MDILSHALWAGAAAEGLRRHYGTSRTTVVATVVLGVVPDLLMTVPVLAWSVTQPHPFALLQSYIAATPGSEPYLPPMVATLEHHLHCIMHSAIIAGAVSLVAWRKRPALLLALVGWWLHIALDIPTHSRDYYAVPFLYPITDWGPDGIAWTTPWVLAFNYLAIAITYAGLFILRRKPKVATATSS